MPTFKHSGDLGDIIFALPAIRALGGGILYLDPNAGANEPAVKASIGKPTRLKQESIDNLRPLLLAQPYIEDVRNWLGEAVNHNLDLFRQHLRFNNLADSHLAAFNLPLTERDKPWITVPEPIKIPNKTIVIARSLRQQGNHQFWESAVPQIRDRCVFVGLPLEHQVFEYVFEEKIEHYPTPDLLTLARVIAGADQFIGNSSFPHTLAEAMKKELILEVNRVICTVVFNRPGAQYV